MIKAMAQKFYSYTYVKVFMWFIGYHFMRDIVNMYQMNLHDGRNDN